MSHFMFFAALLALIAVAFAISMLWQRSRGLALALAIGLPLAAILIYKLKGEPAALEPASIAAPKTMEEAIALLEKRIAEEPDNFEGAVLLARSYMATEKFELARDAYARAMKLKPDDSDLSVEYVGALLHTSNDRRFPPVAVQLLEAAVARNPENQQALFYLGMHRMQSRQPAEAAATWEKLYPLLMPDAQAALRPQIDVAREAAKLPPLPPETPAALRVMDIEVRIDPTLASSVQPGSVLYVYARAQENRGPPVAAKRIVLGTLPLKVQLSDGDSPMPTAPLSSHKKVLLMARLSRTGDVVPATGDIEAQPLLIETSGKTPAALVLDRILP